MKDNTDTIYELLKILPSIYQFHSPTTELYSFLNKIAKVEIKKIFSHTDDTQTKFGQFGEIIFPYRSMGAINSLDLFGLDELIIFSFYWKNKNKYQNVVDIGANIGLHSIVMCRTGYNVRSYEPDPIHYKLFNKNLKLNQCSKVETNKSAVSSRDGEAEFIRVLGNTTGSHIAGAKKDPYGDLEKFKVKIDNFIPIIEWADLIKIDAEGHEADILLSTKGEHWENCDAIVEVGTTDNARDIYKYLNSIDVSMFSQKTNWKRVRDILGMPESYKDGSLFISTKNNMPWE